jgi:hypothetical protein
VRIKARMGMSIDGYIASTDGMPALVKAAGFVPGVSHGYPEFISGCDAVAMGRETVRVGKACCRGTGGCSTTTGASGGPASR